MINRNATITKMDKNSMANNTKTVCVHGTRYREVPGFNTYGISSVGEVINLKTKTTLTPKDYDHWSGRFNLYRKNGTMKTFNGMQLIRMTYSKAWSKSIENSSNLVLA